MFVGTLLKNLMEQPMNTDKEEVYQTVSDMMKEDQSI